MFAHYSFVIFKNKLSDKIITINQILIEFQKNVIYKGIPIACNCLPFCNKQNFEEHVMSKCKGTQLSLTTVEMFDFAKYIVVIRPSSTKV